MPSKTKRCVKGKRRCHTGKCVVKSAYTKTKKCAKGSRKCHDQACHAVKSAKKSPVKSTYNLRNRGIKI